VATLRGHRLEVWSLALLHDNARLVSGCKDGSVYVWDTTRLRRDQTRNTLPEPVRTWRFAADSRSILAVDLPGRLVRWQGAEFREAQTELELGEGVSNALFSPEGRWLVATTADGHVRLWDLQERTLRHEWNAEGIRLFPVGFVPGSNHLLTRRLGEDELQEWDLTTGQEVQSWLDALELGPRSALGFSPDAQWSFLLDAEGAGRLRNLSTSEETIFDLKVKQIAQVAFSPDGSHFAAVSRLGTGCLWETATAQRTATLHGFLQAMNSVTFSPDGKRLAIGGDGNEAVKLWDLDSLQELLTLEGQGSTFNNVAFSPDGNVLAASNGQGILHLWRAPSLKEIEPENALRP
jgi:WD40 repeat protein